MSYNEGDLASNRHWQAKQFKLHQQQALEQQALEQVQAAKYLALAVPDNLDWGHHISDITCMATKTLNFLCCNLTPRQPCLFVLRFKVPVNNFSVMSGWSHRFLGLNQYSGE